VLPPPIASDRCIGRLKSGWLCQSRFHARREFATEAFATAISDVQSAQAKLLMKELPPEIEAALEVMAG
jgi:hypothetical protein